MRVNFTFRHMDASEALKAHTEQKLKRLERFEERELTVSTVFSVEKFHKTAEFQVQGAHGNFLQAATRDDMFEAVDVAVDKLDRQISRAKAKRKHHKGHQSTTPQEIG